MKIQIPQFTTIGEAWLCTVRHCLATGREYEIERGSYVGQSRKQLDSLAFEITQPETRPLAVEFGGVAISDGESIHRYFEDYLINSELKENEQYTYGSRIEPQLDAIAAMLAESPNTNQATIAIAQPSDIHLDDPPCLRSLSWKVTPNGLQLTSFWRSWDLHSALPLNLGGLQLLNEAMAEWAGVGQTGSLVCYSDGSHVYDHAWGMMQ